MLTESTRLEPYVIIGIVGAVTAVSVLAVVLRNHRKLKKEHPELFNGGLYQ